MKTSRSLNDGIVDKMSPFKRINSEFGAWDMATTTSPRFMTSNNNEGTITSTAAAAAVNPTAHGQVSVPVPTKPSRACNKHIHSSLGYSKFDTFIESLDAACEALPTPLIGSARTRPSRASKNWSSTRHGHSHQRQVYPEDRPRSFTGTTKEVKFSDEVIEIVEPTEESVAEAPEFRCSKKNAVEAKEMADVEARESRVAAAHVQWESNMKWSQFAKAATTVQSTYRGYKVRTGQTLKYLLVIGNVKAKLEELRQQFDAWKIAAWFPTDFTERVTMTESVVDLLLQLYTLQGVPIMVREFRKTIAREVIKFQEEVDGFLCRNSKHDMLFDLPRPEGNAPQGKTYPKSSKAFRHRVVFLEPNTTENENDSCRIGHLGSWKVVKGGAMSSTDVKSKLGSDCQSKITEGPLHSSHSDNRSELNFVLWSPEDAQFEKASVKEKTSKENPLENITELKKCVAPLSNFDIYMLPSRNKKSFGTGFGNANIRNRSFGKEYLAAASGQCPHAPTEDSSAFHSTYDQSLAKETYLPAENKSMDFTRNCKQKNDSESAVSINKQQSRDTNAYARMHVPKDFRTANLHEKLDERRATRQSETFTKPDYSSTRKWEAEFPLDTQLCNLTDIDKSCTSTEKSLALKPEPLSKKARDLSTPVPVTTKEFCDTDVRVCQTKLQAFLTDMEYISAKDFTDGTIVAGEKVDIEMNHPLATSHLGLTKENVQLFCVNDCAKSLSKSSEENKIGALQDMEEGLGTKEVEPHDAEVPTAEREQLQKLPTSGREAIELGQSISLTSSESAPRLIPSESMPKGTIHEQAKVELENEFEQCGFDGLETISWCSNCPGYPADCTGESCDFESPFSEQMLHQSYALKGLVKELDEDVSETKGEVARNSEACYWKAEPWKDNPTSELIPCRVAMVASELNFARENEQLMEDDNWMSFEAFKKEVKNRQETLENPVQETGLLSPDEKTPPDINESSCLQSKESSCLESKESSCLESKESSCLESKEPSLACTILSLNEECVTSDKLASVSDESDSSLLLAKLVEDNKRLKEILTEVMKWNTVQASAMLTLNERLEEVENRR